MKAGLVSALRLAALATVAGCTANDDGASDAGRYQGYLEKCHEYCEATVAQGCSAAATVDDCIEGMVCSVFTSNAPPTCKGAFAVYNDCLHSQPDLCTAGDACQAEANAAWDGCWVDYD